MPSGKCHQNFQCEQCEEFFCLRFVLRIKGHKPNEINDKVKLKEKCIGSYMSEETFVVSSNEKLAHVSKFESLKCIYSRNFASPLSASNSLANVLA